MKKKHHLPINCLVSTSSQHVLRYSNALPLYRMIFYLIPLAVDLSTPSAVAGCSGYRSSSHNSPRRGNAPRRQRGPRVLGVCLAMKKLEFMRKFEKIGNYNMVCWEWGNFEKQTSEESGKIWKNLENWRDYSRHKVGVVGFEEGIYCWSHLGIPLERSIWYEAINVCFHWQLEANINGLV